MLIESQNILGTRGGCMARPHTKNKDSFEGRSYFKVKSGCSGQQLCQAPLRIRHQTDKRTVVQVFSTQPGHVNSSTHTSDRHPEGELLNCQRHAGMFSLCSLRGLQGLKDQGLPTSGLTSALWLMASGTRLFSSDGVE